MLSVRGLYLQDMTQTTKKQPLFRVYYVRPDGEGETLLAEGRGTEDGAIEAAVDHAFEADIASPLGDDVRLSYQDLRDNLRVEAG